MEKKDRITFLIPVFNLADERLENFRFVLKKICEVSDQVLVVEQVRGQESGVRGQVEELGAEYLPVEIDDTLIHKSRLINEGVRRCRTPFVWVNDADCYMKFGEVLETLHLGADFIQPYKLARKLTPEQSGAIRSGQKVKVEYQRIKEPTLLTAGTEFGQVCLYSALCFVFRKSAFIEIGKMDARFFGWGLEDLDLCYRVLHSGKCFRIENHKAVHLWHKTPTKRMIGTDSFKRNERIIARKLGLPRRAINNKIKLAYQSRFRRIGIISLPRTGSSCLAGTIRRSTEAKVFGEPFGNFGLFVNKKNPYRSYIERGQYGAYATAVLKNEGSIKHVHDEILDITKKTRGAFSNVSKRIIRSRNIIVFTTRVNFMDWLVSYELALRERNFYGKPYSEEPFEIARSPFIAWLKKWRKWHKVELPRLIALCEELGRDYRVIDYEEIADPQKLEAFVTELFPYRKPGPFVIPTKKQKTKANSEYILNYNEVFSWAGEMTECLTEEVSYG
jgi:hypothetical protein